MLKHRKAEIIRGSHGIHANIYTSGLGIITVHRDKGGPEWSKPKSRWVNAKKAVISWSGGNGNQTSEEAQQFGEFMLWAVRVARKFNVLNPDKLSDDDILYALEGAAPQTHEQWLREKAAIEDESLCVSVGGLVTKLEPTPKRRGPWTVPVEKRNGEEGFQCFCNSFKTFDSYVYAHMNERLTHECDKCGSKFSIKNGVVKVLKAMPKK